MLLMKIKFVEQALRRCLHKIEDWDEKMKEQTEFLCKNWQKEDGADNANTPDAAGRKCLRFAMRTLLTAEAGFTWMDNDDKSESLVENHLRFLAAVLIAGECTSVGAGAYWWARYGVLLLSLERELEECTREMYTLAIHN